MWPQARLRPRAQQWLRRPRPLRSMWPSATPAARAAMASAAAATETDVAPSAAPAARAAMASAAAAAETDVAPSADPATRAAMASAATAAVSLARLLDISACVCRLGVPPVAAEAAGRCDLLIHLLRLSSALIGELPLDMGAAAIAAAATHGAYHAHARHVRRVAHARITRRISGKSAPELPAPAAAAHSNGLEMLVRLINRLSVDAAAHGAAHSSCLGREGGSRSFPAFDAAAAARGPKRKAAPTRPRPPKETTAGGSRAKAAKKRKVEEPAASAA